MTLDWAAVWAVVSLIPFYLLGAFPSGYLVARASGIDIRAVGSGNVGATNVARVMGKKAGISTLLLDVIKGSIAVLFAGLLSSEEWFPAAAGAVAVCGHCFSLPPWLKGGKGVATALGVAIALAPYFLTIGTVVVFAVVFGISRIVSLASISAVLAAPLLAFLLSVPDSISLSLAIIAIIVVARHQPNILRLVAGREPQFQFGAKEKGL